MRTNKIHHGFILALAFLISGCWSRQKQMHQGLVVVNVLEREQFEDCHIPGSINIPFSEYERSLAEIDIHAQVVLYCSDYTCTASRFVAEQLRDHGFENIAVYEGGMADWHQNGYPVEGPCQASEYLTVVHSPDTVSELHEIALITAQDLAHQLGVTLGKKT